MLSALCFYLKKFTRLWLLGFGQLLANVHIKSAFSCKLDHALVVLNAFHLILISRINKLPKTTTNANAIDAKLNQTITEFTASSPQPESEPVEPSKIAKFVKCFDVPLFHCPNQSKVINFIPKKKTNQTRLLDFFRQ